MKVKCICTILKLSIGDWQLIEAALEVSAFELNNQVVTCPDPSAPEFKDALAEYEARLAAVQELRARVACATLKSK